MQTIKLNISDEYGFTGNGKLVGYIHDTDDEVKCYNEKLPCMIVCPGGGYAFTSKRECEPIAIEFYNRHYNAFTLEYDVAPEIYPKALTELACAVDFIRKNAENFYIDSNKIFIIGFSAGGHLVANLANSYNNIPNELIKDKKLDCTPNGVVLSYPVITPSSHVGSFMNLLGQDYNDERAQALSLDKTVTDKNPPTFIWTTSTDDCVNPMATILYAKALQEHKIKYEAHIFPEGRHGISTADDRTNGKGFLIRKTKLWIELADEFLKSL